MASEHDLAFPKIVTIDRHTGNGDTYGDTFSEGGLTKREWFAGMALQVMATKYQAVDAARWSTEYADALIKKLGEKNDK